MSGTSGIEWREETALQRRTRIAFWMVLALSWAVAVFYMWEAMQREPTAPFQRSQLVEPGMPRTLVAAVIFSGIELAIVLAALWPWKPDFYAARLGVTGLVLVTWFTMTTPADLSHVDRIHRRWLAFLVVATATAMVVLIVHGLARRLTRAAST